MPDIVQFIAFLVLGAALGAIGGLFGVGGGLIAIPVLALAFHFEQQHAQGTALAMVAPNVLVGLWSYAKRPGFDRRVALLMACSAMPFTYLGAHVAVHVESAGLRTAFAAFLAVLAAWVAVRAVRVQRRRTMPPARLAWGWTSVVGAIGGLLSGIFSIGGAAFAVPMLAMFFGFAQAAAQGATLGLVVPSTLVSIATYAVAGDVDWGIGIPMAVGGTLCVRFGVGLAYRLPDRTLRLLFSLLLAGSSLALFTKA